MPGMSHRQWHVHMFSECGASALGVSTKGTADTLNTVPRSDRGNAASCRPALVCNCLCKAVHVVEKGDSLQDAA